MTLLKIKPTILIVDDEAPVRAVISVYCHLAGYDSILAEDGLQALQATQAISIDLIITDFRMPAMDGLDFCRQLRLTDRNKATPVIMCTGSIAELDISALELELAPISIVEKPFHPAYLPKIPHADG